MELLLNLAWLLLALPAWWLWRRRKPTRKFSSLHCLLALACVLVVLFPVISATDDLRAMRAEMEESPEGKRTIRQAGHDRPSAWKWQNPPSLTATAISPVVSKESWHALPVLSLAMPAIPVIEPAGRAPPRSFLR